MSSRSSTEEEPSASQSSDSGASASDLLGDGRRLPERIEVGSISSPHGVQGEVAVRVESDNPERFAAGSRLFARLSTGRERSLTVTAARAHRGGLLVRFEGVETRTGAEELQGATLEVSRTAVPAAEEGAFYYFELVGCRCRDRTLGFLGVVEEVIEDGGGLLLLVADGERKVPVPFVRAFVDRVDIEKGQIDLALPEGLVETCAST